MNDLQRAKLQHDPNKHYANGHLNDKRPKFDRSVYLLWLLIPGMIWLSCQPLFWLVVMAWQGVCLLMWPHGIIDRLWDIWAGWALILGSMSLLVGGIVALYTINDQSIKEEYE